jgi:protein TonB
MKTESEQVPRWDDIIFENRNKAYGAYIIRKNYNTRVLKAEGISIGMGALIFIIPILMRDEIPLPVIPKPDSGTVLEVYDGTIEPRVTPPPPQPPRRVDASIIPTRVTTQEVPDQPPSPPTDEVTYTTGPETGSTETSPDVGTESGTGTLPVEIPATPYVLAPQVMPSFEGGMEGMMKFIQKKLCYPRHAQANNEEGTVYVSFIINSMGKVTDVEVIKGFHKDCDQEAVRVISLMNKWKPGLQNKMPVAVKMVLPIKFKLGS